MDSTQQAHTEEEEEEEDNRLTPVVSIEEDKLTPLLSPPPAAATATAAAKKKPQEYRLKDIQWRDAQTGRLREVKIVTQNENGPCPLIALINVLTLSNSTASGFTIGAASKRTTTDEELVGLLANHLLLRTEPPSSYDVGSGGGEPVPAEHDINAVLSLLPTLSKGLDVDLQFSHIYDFATTPASLLFRAFGVDLVHGWVVDPEKEQSIAAILLSDCRNSYEGAVEFIFAADELSGGQVLTAGDSSQQRPASRRSTKMSDAQNRTVCNAVLLSEWMDANATQLTECGLHNLGTMLPANHLCVLFRNNHFSTLFRRGTGELYLLCTDDVVAGDERIVWETLSDVRQTSARFLDSQFQPLTVATGGGGQFVPPADSRETTEDYVCESSARGGSGGSGDRASEQIDEDYALALRLHDEEQQQQQQQSGGGGSGQQRRLQVRQQDRLPPGMDVKEHGQLYGVPVVTREGENRLARAIYRSASDENFSRRMTDAFLPHEAAATKAKQQQQQQRPKDKSSGDSDRCVIC
ncbi:hypothetical protein GGF42_004278 [Coemansia sp. RSA 2424]|nr:hypothetical protein GGF42_004278 [Coemansia sp. RSA 2424]